MDLETIDTLPIADILNQDLFEDCVFRDFDGVCSAISSPKSALINHSLQVAHGFPGDENIVCEVESDGLAQCSDMVQNALDRFNMSKRWAEDGIKRKGGVSDYYNKRCSAFVEWKPNVGVPLVRGQRKSQELVKRCMHMMKDLHNHRRSPFISSPHDEAVDAHAFNANTYDKLAIHHVIAERKRREKMNESFSALRALLPEHTHTLKRDRASILLHTKEYVIHLKARLRELEQRNSILEALLKGSKTGAPSASISHGGCDPPRTELGSHQDVGTGLKLLWPTSDDVTVEMYELSNIEPFGAELRVCVRNPSNATDVMMSLFQFIKATNLDAFSMHCQTECDSQFRASVKMKGRAEL